MSDKIKEILETPIIPDELKPEKIPELLEKRGGRSASDDSTENDGVLRDENIKALDGSAKSGKKKIIRTVCTYSAAAAACLLIVGGVMKFIPHGSKDMMTAEMFTGTASGINTDSKRKRDAAKSEEAASDNTESYEAESSEDLASGTFAYVNAESYEQLFDRAKNARITRYELNGVVSEDEDAAEYYYGEDSSLEYSNGLSDDVYDTLRQVEGIAEADIIKANDRGVFYVTNNSPVTVSAYYGKSVIYIPVDKETGRFGEKLKLDVASDAGILRDSWFDVSAMYLTDKKLTVIISSWFQRYGDAQQPAMTTVLTYDISGETPVFSGKGVQSGTYSSSRMKGDLLYLVTDQSSWNTFIDYNYGYDDEESDTDKEKNFDNTDRRLYVPFYGESYEKAECLELPRIFIPENDDAGCDTLVISGIDINLPESAVSSVAVSGYTGDIYCTADSLYIQQVNYDNELVWRGLSTTFSKFSLKDGIITPQGSGKVNGTVLNQFSMGEYNGYFIAATTSYDYNEKGAESLNYLFVLDSDMNVVSSVNDIAPNETIKSVNIQGNMAYVVTYERTDPLFAIDLSDPSSPVITDELKINGYSSFLWKWDDDHLIGFGVDATEEGIETGVKLVMFDVSDNGELKEDGYYAISNNDYYHSAYSTAVYDRKALLLDPEKNLIGFPLEEFDKGWNYKFSYALFSYADGEFTEKGRIESGSEYTNFNRGLYIGDHLFVFSQDEAVSVDINTMTETDRTEFDTQKYDEETMIYNKTDIIE